MCSLAPYQFLLSVVSLWSLCGLSLCLSLCVLFPPRKTSLFMFSVLTDMGQRLADGQFDALLEPFEEDMDDVTGDEDVVPSSLNWSAFDHSVASQPGDMRGTHGDGGGQTYEPLGAETWEDEHLDGIADDYADVYVRSYSIQGHGEEVEDQWDIGSGQEDDYLRLPQALEPPARHERPPLPPTRSVIQFPSCL